MQLPKRLFKNCCAWHNCVAQGLKMLIYYFRKLRFFALSRLVLPALTTFLNSLLKIG
jgi:hypothetical protein